MRIIINNFVTLLKVGYFPYFPGTVGSFFSYIILIIANIYLSYLSLIFFFILIFIISIYFINIYLKDLQDHDPKEIVIDEFIGQSIPLLAISTSNELNIKLIVFLKLQQKN